MNFVRYTNILTFPDEVSIILKKAFTLQPRSSPQSRATGIHE